MSNKTVVRNGPRAGPGRRGSQPIASDEASPESAGGPRHPGGERVLEEGALAGGALEDRVLEGRALEERALEKCALERKVPEECASGECVLEDRALEGRVWEGCVLEGRVQKRPGRVLARYADGRPARLSDRSLVRYTAGGQAVVLPPSSW